MLQRSVTLIRRFVCRRPKPSTRFAASARNVSLVMLGHVDTRVDPLVRSVGPVFLLPDRDDLFDGVDQPLPGGEGFAAMRRADGDRDAGFAELQMPDAMHQRAFD